MTTPRFAFALITASTLIAFSAQAADTQLAPSAGALTREQVTAEFLRARAAGELDFSRQFEPSTLATPRDQATRLSSPRKAAEQDAAPKVSEAKAAYRYAMAVGEEDRGRALAVAAMTDGLARPAATTAPTTQHASAPTTQHASAPSEYTGTLQ